MRKLPFYVKILLFYTYKFPWKKKSFLLFLSDHLTNPFIEDSLFSITWFELYWTVVSVHFSNYLLLDIRQVMFTSPCPHYRKHFIAELLNSLVNSLKAWKIYVLFITSCFLWHSIFQLQDLLVDVCEEGTGSNFICYVYWLKSLMAVTASYRQ